MLPRHLAIPALILTLAACATAQASEKKSQGAPAPGLTDQDLDQRRANLDAKLASRTSKVKQSLDRIAAYQLKAEKDRLDFERYIAEERKAFYQFLKSVKADERDSELNRFTDKQEKARKDFDEKQLDEQKSWFKETIEKPWRSESLELESASAPPLNAPEPKAAAKAEKAEPAAEPRKPAKPMHKAVYKKKSKPVVKKKPVEPAVEQTQMTPVAPAPAPAPAPMPQSEPQPSPDAAPPPPPGQ